MVNNKIFLCILDYYKFPIVKVGNLSTDDLLQVAKLIFAEYGLCRKNCFRCRYKLQIGNVQGFFSER